MNSVCGSIEHDGPAHVRPATGRGGGHVVGAWFILLGVLAACGPIYRPKPEPIQYRFTWSASVDGEPVRGEWLITCKPVYYSFSAGESGLYAGTNTPRFVSVRTRSGAAAVVLTPGICNDQSFMDLAKGPETTVAPLTTPVIWLDRWPGTSHGQAYISADALAADDAKIGAIQSSVTLGATCEEIRLAGT